MNQKYLLPTYRISGYTPISGYSGIASHGEYGEDGSYGEPISATTVALWSIGSAVVGGGAIGGIAYASGKKKGKKKGKKQQKAKSKKHYTAKMEKADEAYKKERAAMQEAAATKQRELQTTISNREEERDRVAENLRRQIQVTHFSDTKREQIGVGDQDLERLYAKERSQMLEEFATVGAQASQEIEEIRLKEEGADAQGINWKLILGSALVIGGGAYILKNKKKRFKKKKRKK